MDRLKTTGGMGIFDKESGAVPSVNTTPGHQGAPVITYLL